MNLTTILLAVVIIGAGLFIAKKFGAGCCGTKKSKEGASHEHKHGEEGGCCGHKH